MQYVPDPGDSAMRQAQVRECIKSLPYPDHLIETAGPRRTEMVARMQELGIS